MLKKRRSLSYEGRKSLNGFLFILPWLIGLIFFFLRPMISTIWLSFQDVTISNGSIIETFVGLANYKQAFMTDSEYLPALSESMRNIVLQVPLIIVFSMFIATLLNNKFHGNVFFRAIFFLPVILSSGPVLSMLQEQDAAKVVSGDTQTMLFSAVSLSNVLTNYGFGTEFVTNITTVVDSIFSLVWKSGVQILLYISALKSISPALYEASAMEGATKWEDFWKITFPMTTPILLTNIVYSIIDQFTDMTNPMIEKIYTASKAMQFDYSAAMSMVYFVLIMIIIGIVYKLLNKRVFYMVD